MRWARQTATDNGVAWRRVRKSGGGDARRVFRVTQPHIGGGEAGASSRSDTHCKISNYSWPCRWWWWRCRRRRHTRRGARGARGGAGARARVAGSWRVLSRRQCAEHCTPPPARNNRRESRERAVQQTNRRYSRCGESATSAGAKCGHRVLPALREVFCRFRWQGARAALSAAGRRPAPTRLLHPAPARAPCPCAAP